jgi:hypothetical protein
MYPPKERAAKLLAVGDSMSEVAKAIGKTEKTVKLWLLDSDFCDLLRRNASGAALRHLVGYLSGENEDKDRAMVALALLRMNKPSSPPRNGPRRTDTEDEPGLEEFSTEQLKRLTGDD